MIRKVNKFIEENQLLWQYDKVIVALSGGADSVALLHILHRLGYDCIAAHCNFHLRDQEANRDEYFSRNEAEKLNIPFYLKNFNTKDYSRLHKLSVEMAARELRYRWFEELRIETGAKAIAVGHHQDDSIETFILNLIRGTGVRGLSGIRPKNGYIIRPLLAVNRAGIINWLGEQNIKYQTDSTNLSDEYTRNYIRLNILPLMKELNPSVGNAVLRTSEHLYDLQNIYLNWIREERDNIFSDGEKIPIAELMQSVAPKSLLYELIKPLGFTRPIADDVFNSLNKQSGKIFDAPTTHFRIIKDREYLLVTTRKENENAYYNVNVNESMTFPIKLTTSTYEINQPVKIYKNQTTALLDYHLLSFPLVLRTWKEGDWFIPFGMKGRKKLSDYFSDRKFSRIRKQQTWLLCNGSDVIWIVGERIDERYRISKNTKIIFKAQYFM